MMVLSAVSLIIMMYTSEHTNLGYVNCFLGSSATSQYARNCSIW